LLTPGKRDIDLSAGTPPGSHPASISLLLLAHMVELVGGPWHLTGLASTHFFHYNQSTSTEKDGDHQLSNAGSFGDSYLQDH